MNSLERSLAAKAGYDNGWEVSSEDPAAGAVTLSSALHKARAVIASVGLSTDWLVALPNGRMAEELSRITGVRALEAGRFAVSGEKELAILLSHASRLARTLPNLPQQRFEKAVTEELARITAPAAATEVERLVRQRVGQDVYRESLMDYWSGACAVLGINEPALLRASHAKAWAECSTDEERLSVFNGFLLCAHLDALFDRYLMTFDSAGRALFAPAISSDNRARLGLSGELRLQSISPEHETFLNWHRGRFNGRHGSP